MKLFFISILFLMFGTVISCILPKKIKLIGLSLVMAISSAISLIPSIHVLLGNGILQKTVKFNYLFGKVTFTLDPLAAFFIIIISIMSLLGVIYSNGYLKPYVERNKSINPHMIFLSMLVAAMQLVLTCQNAFMFLIFWEIMSLSSFFLVIFEHEKKEVLKAGIKYLVFMHFSVLFIIMAFAIASLASKSFDFTQMGLVISKDVALANTVFILAFIGFSTKAGLVPFHNWLPDAHPTAPSHVSGMMSGVMIKTGIYGILRMVLMVGTPSKTLSYMVLIIAIISGLYGVLYAITQHDMKKLLAYSSIENIAIISIGIGIGMLGLTYGNHNMAFCGFAGAILHILNHSIFKELLFFGAGSVYLKSHTRDVELLGGLIKSMPKTATLFVIASIAICGLPPLNGFISEFLIYLGIIKGLTIHHFLCVTMILVALAALALIGTMAILCFSKVSSIVFLGVPRSDHAKDVTSDAPYSMIIPMSILAIFAFAIGLFPQQVVSIISKPVEIFVGDSALISSCASCIMQVISSYSLLLLVVILALAFLKYSLQKKKIEKFETWGCGYNKPDSKIQYTASSYAKPFVVVLRPFFKKVFDVVRPKKLFPKEAHYSSHIDDIEEAYFIDPLVKFDEHFLSKFEKLQDGNIQTYIQYGIGFLVIILIGCFFIK